jgi:hypothetical protein
MHNKENLLFSRRKTPDWRNFIPIVKQFRFVLCAVVHTPHQCFNHKTCSKKQPCISSAIDRRQLDLLIVKIVVAAILIETLTEVSERVIGCVFLLPLLFKWYNGYPGPIMIVGITGGTDVGGGTMSEFKFHLHLYIQPGTMALVVYNPVEVRKVLSIDEQSEAKKKYNG